MLIPGRQPMGLVMTMVLGLAGSLLGGFISTMIYRYSATVTAYQPSGLAMSIVGAIRLLAAYVMLNRRQALAKP